MFIGSMDKSSVSLYSDQNEILGMSWGVLETSHTTQGPIPTHHCSPISTHDQPDVRKEPSGSLESDPSSSPSGTC